METVRRILETIAAFRFEDVAFYVLSGAALGLAAGLLIVMRFRRTGFFSRPTRLWTLFAKFQYAWMPLAFACGFAALAGVFGMAHLARAYVGSDRAAVAGSCANSVDGVLSETAWKIRGSGLGEEAFPEIARAVSDAASIGVYRGLSADPGFAALFGPARNRVNAGLREFFGGRLREAALAGAVTDASVLCEVARPRLRDAIMGGGVNEIVLKASSGIFSPLYFFALALFPLLLAPCLLEDLFHILFRTAFPKDGEGPLSRRGQVRRRL
jgi:hypothetical protein